MFCDRLRLLTGAVLMDEEQGGYRVYRPNFRRRQVSDLEGRHCLICANVIGDVQSMCDV